MPQSGNPSMLRPLTDRLVDLSRQQETPVLIVPPRISLRSAFFVELIRSLRQSSKLPLQVDWLRDGNGLRNLVGDYFAAMMARRINRQLASDGVLLLTSSITRPNQQPGIVIGIAQHDQVLPPWALAVRLTSQRED